MFKSAKASLFVKAIAVVAIGGLLLKAALDFGGGIRFAVSARGPGQGRGEYGGDLDFLRRHHISPQSPGESNHSFDLWSPGALAALLRVNGLTNNRALFIDSHGRAGFLWHGRGYGLYPRETLLRPGEPTPCFSAADFAAILGGEKAAAIHNIVIAGCNEEGRFRSQEWRRHFVNATNVTFMTPGKLSFKPMFYQAIVTPSGDIQPLYGKVCRTSDRTRCDIERTPSPGAEPLGAYLAHLYLPGARKPFRAQRAGRELLEPGRCSTDPARSASLAPLVRFAN